MRYNNKQIIVLCFSFLDYLSKTYIYEDSTFPPTLWAHPPDGSATTTNCAENFHRNYNANFYKAHPNIFSVIDILKDIQLETETKFKSIAQGVVYEKRSQQVNKQIMYLRIYMSYVNNEITRENYLQIMGNFFKGKKV